MFACLIAPDFEEGALDILTTKKGGRFYYFTNATSQ